ncbi:MAG: hypothetical protein M1417_02490, partial [Candidatus Thermoplasmatota archaeon]|nr:hypothetical protein [Candidatus Thermoplasmatota archaeon]
TGDRDSHSLEVEADGSAFLPALVFTPFDGVVTVLVILVLLLLFIIWRRRNRRKNRGNSVYLFH